MTDHRVVEKPGQEPGDRPETEECWTLQGAVNRKQVRVWGYIGGHRHGLIHIEFEAATVIGYARNSVPVAPTALANIPRRLAKLLKPLGIEHVAWEGQVTRIDLAVHFEIESEDEWDRVMDVGKGLRAYNTLGDLYKGKRYPHPDPARPHSECGIGMKTKSETRVIRIYRIDLKERKRAQPPNAPSTLVGKIEIAIQNDDDLEAALSPFCHDRKLPTVLGSLDFQGVVQVILGWLKWDKVYDPEGLTDEEVFQIGKYPRIAPRLRALLADCHDRGIEAVGDRPSSEYPLDADGKSKALKDDLKSLIGLGLTPYTVHRQEAFVIRRVIEDGWTVFEALRLGYMGTDLEPPMRNIDAAEAEALERELASWAVTGVGPFTHVRRQICGLGCSEYQARKMLRPVGKNLHAVRRKAQIAENLAQGLDEQGNRLMVVDPNALLDSLAEKARAAGWKPFTPTISTTAGADNAVDNDDDHDGAPVMEIVKGADAVVAGTPNRRSTPVEVVAKSPVTILGPHLPLTTEISLSPKDSSGKCCDGTPLSAACAPYYPPCDETEARPMITPSDPKATVQVEFTGKAVRILDGDTIEVMRNGKPDRIRLYGIDCPEKRQAFGNRAKKFTANFVGAKNVTVTVKGKDRYARTIGEIVLPDGRVLNHELVRAELAWHYRKYAPDDKQLQQLEKAARDNKAGLWVDVHPVAPWEFRKRK